MLLLHLRGRDRGSWPCQCGAPSPAEIQRVFDPQVCSRSSALGVSAGGRTSSPSSARALQAVELVLDQSEVQQVPDVAAIGPAGRVRSSTNGSNALRLQHEAGSVLDLGLGWAQAWPMQVRSVTWPTGTGEPTWPGSPQCRVLRSESCSEAPIAFQFWGRFNFSNILRGLTCATWLGRKARITSGIESPVVGIFANTSEVSADR